MAKQTNTQLAKYMKADGYYDIGAIRKDLREQGYQEPDLFDSIFGGSDDADQPITAPAKHPLWQAAIDANAAKDSGFVETTETVVDYFENEDGSAEAVERKIKVRKPKNTQNLDANDDIHATAATKQKAGTMAAKTTVTPQLTHTQDYVLERITIDKPTTLSPRDGFVWTLNYNISTIRALVKKGVLEWGQHDRPRYGQTENETKVRLTDLGREYAILQGWLPAPTEAPQAAPVASADSGEAVVWAYEVNDVLSFNLSGKEGDETVGLVIGHVTHHIHDIKTPMYMVSTSEGTNYVTEAQIVGLVFPHATPAAQDTSAQAGGEAGSDDDEPEGYARPCDVCDGSGTIAHKDYGYLPCSSCDGTGIYTPEGELVRASVNAMAEKDARIAALEAELATARAEIKRLKKTSRMDDGYIDFLEAKRED